MLHIESFGHGPSLVLVHGWGMSGAVWAPVVDDLSGRYTVHLIDLPGHGRSNHMDTEGLDLVRLADCLSACIPEQAAWVGWSLGGMAVLQLALQNPGQVRRLILVSSTPRFVAGDGWDHAMPARKFAVFRRRFHDKPKTTMDQFIQLMVNGTGDASKLQVQSRVLAHTRTDLTGTIDYGLKILACADLRSALAQVRMPMYLMHGSHDALIPSSAARWLAAGCNAPLATLQHAGHVPFLMDPHWFTEGVHAFLRA